MTVYPIRNKYTCIKLAIALVSIAHKFFMIVGFMRSKTPDYPQVLDFGVGSDASTKPDLIGTGTILKESEGGETTTSRENYFTLKRLLNSIFTLTGNKLFVIAIVIVSRKDLPRTGCHSPLDWVGKKQTNKTSPSFEYSRGKGVIVFSAVDPENRPLPPDFASSRFQIIRHV